MYCVTVCSSWILQLNAFMLYVQSTSFTQLSHSCSIVYVYVCLCVPVLFVFITGAIELSVLYYLLVCLARF